MDRLTIQRNLKNCSLRDNEDLPVIDYIDSINRGQKISLLEVGSGECRFVKKIKDIYPNITITCVEINQELAEIAKGLGLEVINKNILDVEATKEYDIVHCSHVIEHFYYPQVLSLVDFLVASTRINGALIIRSPYLREVFYFDMDHVRPYYPETIIGYYYLHQQQRKGQASIRLTTKWFRTSPKSIQHLQTWNFLYLFKPLRPVINRAIDCMNRIYEYFWNRYRMPSSHPTGYVAIFKVEGK